MPCWQRHTLPHARTCEQAVLLLAMPTVAVVSVLVTSMGMHAVVGWRLETPKPRLNCRSDSAIPCKCTEGGSV